ncbi:hypothetical protein [Solidesulfovibrio sp.]|uniref:hypothetical protein n=1 Tax=Solidesulfovibrio sp. TaxID=2910990 RepID=UPI00262602E4|nr:hypothetical protein [Solidesulfovibrio sp.]
MDHDALKPYFAALRERTRPDGACALTPDGEPRPDATAWAAMALHAAGLAPEAVAAARAALARLQAADGRVPLLPGRPEAAWPTVLAMAAWLPDPAYDGRVRAGAAWLLGHPGATWKKDPNGIFGHDPSIKGWNWIEGTHSWVEPTSQAVLVLAALPEPPAGLGPALDEAARLLLDRQLPDGGWNYGNTRVFQNMLLPIPECTGHALAALAGRAGREAVTRSLAYLSGPDCAAATPLCATWRAFGLGAWDAAGPDILENLAVALGRQQRYGPYDTPLLAQLLAAAASRGRFADIVRRSAHG